MNEQETKLEEIESDIKLLKMQYEKLDRLVYKLYRRLNEHQSARQAMQ